VGHIDGRHGVAVDTLDLALQRETWEEAGLQLAELTDLRYGGRLHTCRPARDGKGAGYVSEHIDWYRCMVPEGTVPVNQDGEVECFALMDGDELLRQMQQGQFTLEAALIQAALLGGN
jgi:8-oxo-dGTP pyrophosphatase MutT (NUDIX family)